MKLNKLITKLNAGNSLVELLIAAMIISLVLVAVATTMMFSLKREALNRYRQTAVELASQAIEHLSFERARLGWEGFLDKYELYENYCFGEDLSGEVEEHQDTECSYDEPDHVIPKMGVGFLRDVEIVEDANPITQVVKLTVTVDIEWKPDGGDTITYQIVREFTKNDF